jgi:hypothetical protein
LGDGSIKIFEMYAGSVIWDGEVKRVEVNASDYNNASGVALEIRQRINISADV